MAAMTLNPVTDKFEPVKPDATAADLLLGNKEKFDATIRQLKEMHQDNKREADYWRKVKSRKLLRSERAMTIAHHEMRADALDHAIKVMALSRYMSEQK